MEVKERLRSCHPWEETTETGRVSTKYDPGTEKHISEKTGEI